jgi:hypothetical protein
MPLRAWLHLLPGQQYNLVLQYHYRYNYSKSGWHAWLCGRIAIQSITVISRTSGRLWIVVHWEETISIIDKLSGLYSYLSYSEGRVWLPHSFTGNDGWDCITQPSDAYQFTHVRGNQQN